MNYDILMIDPPWLKKKGGLRKTRPNQSKSFDYRTMPTGEIFNLLDEQIFPYTNENHCVFMWTIDQYLVECEKEMLSRGYKRHCRFIWNKLNGVAPAFTVRYSHEYLIWYYKEKLLPIVPEERGKYMTVFEEKSREHSRKPDYAYSMVETLYPHANKIDVFSREYRIGWAQFGDEVNKF